MRSALWVGLFAFVLVALGVAPAAAQAPAKPGPEHEKLRQFEGEWDAKVSFTGGESNATATYKVGLGGFWLQSHFKGEFGGMARSAFQALAQLRRPLADDAPTAR